MDIRPEIGHTPRVERERERTIGGTPRAPTGSTPVPAVADVAVQPRIGAAERDVAEQRLRQALRDDVLTITEYDERLGLVMAARVQSDLDHVLADLPQPPQRPSPTLPTCDRVVAVLGNTEQRGRWRPASGLRAIAVMGSAKVDLRDAVSDDGTFDIDAYAVMGTVEVIVPDGSAVIVDGFIIMGDRQNTTSEPAGGPAVRVRGYGLMGEVKVRPASKRERRRFPVGDEAPAPPAPSPARPTMRRGWGRKVAAVAVIGLLGAGPIRAVATADAVALFGSREYLPTKAELAGDNDIAVASFFGSVEVVLPDDVGARYGGLQMFGSAECGLPCDMAADATQVEIEATTMFGSTQIRHVGETGHDDD